MEIQTKVRYNYRQNLYYIDAKDPSTESIIANPRMYETEAEACIAESIMKYMFSTYQTRAEFDLDIFTFKVRAVFHLLNTKGKW